MPRVGLVGGTGFTRLLPAAEPLDIETPYGDVRVGHVREGALEAFHLLRHGSPHVPAHRVEHRANVDALARCKVDAVLAINSVGALGADVPPGTLLVPDDLLDLAPYASFHDDAPVHVDVSEPYCPRLRRALLDAARAEGRPARDGGVYAATRGPRLETRAEVAALRQLGGTVVGMTGGAEAVLARERALCYASLCMVTNLGTGVAGARPDADAIKRDAAALAEVACAVALRAARSLAARTCACGDALARARL